MSETQTPVTDYIEHMGRIGAVIPPGTYVLERPISGTGLRVIGSPGGLTIFKWTYDGAFISAEKESADLFKNNKIKDLTIETSFAVHPTGMSDDA